MVTLPWINMLGILGQVSTLMKKQQLKAMSVTVREVEAKVYWDGTIEKHRDAELAPAE